MLAAVGALTGLCETEGEPTSAILNNSGSLLPLKQTKNKINLLVLEGRTQGNTLQRDRTLSSLRMLSSCVYCLISPYNPLTLLKCLHSLCRLFSSKHMQFLITSET